jgi:hypothetical protein
MSRHLVRGLLWFAVAALLAGCEVSSSGERGSDPMAAVESALASLAGQAAVVYRLAGGNTLNVTKNGLVQGTIPLDGGQARVLQVSGDLYLSASPAYWQARGMAASRAAEYGNRWARSALAFDLGRSLNPAALARELAAGLPSTLRAEPVPLPDGTTVFDVGGLRVTAGEPHRVVDIAPVLLGPAVAQLFGNLPLALDGLSTTQLGPVRAAFDDTVDGLGQPFVAGPVVAAVVTRNTLHCIQSGECTDVVRVANTLVGDAPEAAARVVLRTSMTSGPLGEQECGQALVVPLNGEVDMSCSVRFTLPKRARGGTATVVAVPSATAEPVAVFDPASLKQEVATELGD